MANKVHSRVQLENRVVVNPGKNVVCEWASGSPPPPLGTVCDRRCLFASKRLEIDYGRPIEQIIA